MARCGNRFIILVAVCCSFASKVRGCAQGPRTPYPYPHPYPQLSSICPPCEAIYYLTPACVNKLGPDPDPLQPHPSTRTQPERSVYGFGLSLWGPTQTQQLRENVTART